MSRPAQVLAAAGILVASCGGRSEHASNGGSGGSSNAAGSAGSAGSSIAAGSSALGGSGGTPGSGGHAVTSTGGSIAVTGGSGGTGNVIEIGTAGAFPADELPRCLQPIDAGTCRGAFARWAFDPSTLRCVPFTYGGCEGNDNNFEAAADCESACVAPLPAGCEPALTGSRPEQCPCTNQTQCDGAICNSPSEKLGGTCQPATVGYCERFGGEGDCFCTLDGNHGCGV